MNETELKLNDLAGKVQVHENRLNQLELPDGNLNTFLGHRQQLKNLHQYHDMQGEWNKHQTEWNQAQMGKDYCLFALLAVAFLFLYLTARRLRKAEAAVKYLLEDPARKEVV